MLLHHLGTSSADQRRLSYEGLGADLWWKKRIGPVLQKYCFRFANIRLIMRRFTYSHLFVYPFLFLLAAAQDATVALTDLSPPQRDALCLTMRSLPQPEACELAKALFYILYYCSEHYLAVPLQRLVLAIEMDSQIAGVTLLSFANGAPDFFTALAGSGSGEGPLEAGCLWS
ncbi:hypothetical protein L0F63_004449 [Massospora cicadina]|nr:hypothetical protein L0F63_004449 [Massospora cicadina]